MVPLTSAELKFRKKWNLTRPSDDTVPFHSEYRVEIYALYIREIRSGATRYLICEKASDDFFSDQRFFQRQLDTSSLDFVLRHRYPDFVDYVVRSLLKLYKYREVNDERIGKWEYEPPERLVLIVEKDFAKLLPGGHNLDLPGYSESQVVFGSQEVGR